MTENVWTLDIEGSRSAPAIAVAGDLVFAVRSPRTTSSVTVVVSPNVAHFQETVETPPGIEVGNVLVLTPTDDTVMGMISVGDAASKSFLTDGKEYRLTLQAIANTTREGELFPVYRFFLQELPVGSHNTRWMKYRAIVESHSAAESSRDWSAVIQTADSFADAVAAELSPTLIEHRTLVKVLYNKGIALGHAGQREAERLTYTRIIEELDVQDGETQEWIASAILARAYSYGEDGQHEQAVRDLADIDRRYRGLPGLGPMVMVAKAQINMADALRRLDRLDEMRAVAQQVVARYGDHDEPSLIEQVTLAEGYLK